MATKTKTEPAEAAPETLPAETNGAALAEANFDFLADAGEGTEGADAESFAIPFLRALQKTTPQADPDDPEYIDGAKAGMFMNSVTLELFEGKERGVVLLPCAFQRRFLRWGARDAGGGYKGDFLPEEAEAMRERGEVVGMENRLYFPEPNGELSEKRSDVLTDTRSHFCLLLDEKTGAASPVLLALSSTQIKKSKQLMYMLKSVKVDAGGGRKVTPPTWMNRVRMTTVLENNDQGSWHGVRFAPEGLLDPSAGDLYREGKAFHDSVIAGEVGAKYEAAPTDGESEKF